MMNWNIVVVVIGSLLAFFLVYREYKRQDRSHLAWRIIAVLIAVTALICIAVPIHYYSTKNSIRKASILLTQGFNRDSIDNNTTVYTLDKNIHQQYPKAKIIYDLDDRFNYAHVYGYGLSQQELKQLKGSPIVFHPSTLPDGIIAINWTEQIKSGQQFKVQGRYQNTTAKNCKLFLMGLNTALDSVTIRPKSITQFSFTVLPKSTGRITYNLLALSDNDTSQHEYLPVVISPAQPLKVLMLSASPDFETKFLKSWLGGNGYSLANRSAITKGKVSQDYINISEIGLSKITATVLSKFDIVISDLSSIDELGAQESVALQQEISQKGIGLIIRADSSAKKSSWAMRYFDIQQQRGKPAIEASLLLQNQYTTSKITTDQDFLIPQNNTQALITDEYQHLLVGSTLTGAGKLIVTTINHTYTWVLAGNQKDYASVWSLLLDKATRKKNDSVQWRVETNLPMVNQAVKLNAESVIALAEVKINGSLVYPYQNAIMPFSSQYTYWPSNSGWQQITQKNRPVYWWYAWDETNWHSLKAAEKIAVTSNYSRRAVGVTKLLSQKTRVNVPEIYFYMLFLMAMAFLWIERKFFSL